jgi:hypothetical protein
MRKMSRILVPSALLIAAVSCLACGSKTEEARKQREASARQLAMDLAKRRQAEPLPAPTSPLLFDVFKLAGATKARAEAVLGEPSRCEFQSYGQDCSFARTGVEIVFRNGKADWITIPAVGVPFAAGSIASIGLAPARPAFSNENVIRWKEIQGLLEVSLFPGRGGKADYFYVLSRTRPL